MSDSEIIEAMAKAMWDEMRRKSAGPSGPVAEDDWGPVADYWRDYARAALKALREVTQ